MGQKRAPILAFIATFRLATSLLRRFRYFQSLLPEGSDLWIFSVHVCPCYTACVLIHACLCDPVDCSNLSLSFLFCKVGQRTHFLGGTAPRLVHTHLAAASTSNGGNAARITRVAFREAAATKISVPYLPTGKTVPKVNQEAKNQGILWNASWSYQVTPQAEVSGLRLRLELSPSCLPSSMRHPHALTAPNHRPLGDPTPTP